MAVGDKRTNQYGINTGFGTWIRGSYALTTLYVSGSVPLVDFELLNLDWFASNAWD